MTHAPRLILASTSATRQQMLRQAGVPFTTDTPRVDEAMLRDSLQAEGASLEDAVAALAEAKAMSVARRLDHGQALVLGADSIAAVTMTAAADGSAGDMWLEKASDRAMARQVLDRLNGRTHHLASGAVVVRGDTAIWRHVAVTRLTMRQCSATFLEAYLDRLGEAAFDTVGCYHLERQGAQLFSRVDGDLFTVLGLPLLPVLGFLREHGVIDT
ncbi:MAG: Maf family protein [Alphaproteobacteria bacterium]